MRKLRKLSENKSLFKVVIIYGTVAVGKFTVANELRRLINYKFFHNHHTHDLARQLFERNTIHMHRIIENLRLALFKEIAEAKINVVTTHAYSSDFVSLTGLTDPQYIRKVETIIKKAGGQACFVHLITDEKTLLKRVIGKSRKNFKKLIDPKLLKEHLAITEWKKIAPVKNNLQINNTNLSPKKVADMIIKHFKIKLE